VAFTPDGRMLAWISDRDGRPDRWQSWQRGRLVSEELDTDGDGRRDDREDYDRDTLQNR